MSSIESAERHQPDDLSLVLLRFCVHHTLVLKPTKAWKFELECWIAPARCGETVVWDLRRASVERRRALFRPVLRFRKVCIMKLSHFRGSLHVLTEIPGVNPSLRQRCASHYPSMKVIAAAA